MQKTFAHHTFFRFFNQHLYVTRAPTTTAVAISMGPSPEKDKTPTAVCCRYLCSPRPAPSGFGGGQHVRCKRAGNPAAVVYGSTKSMIVGRTVGV